jgi:hypothetical protein
MVFSSGTATPRPRLGPRLVANIVTYRGGTARAELINAATGDVIAGFSMEECVPFQGEINQLGAYLSTSSSSYSCRSYMHSCRRVACCDENVECMRASKFAHCTCTKTVGAIHSRGKGH